MTTVAFAIPPSTAKRNHLSCARTAEHSSSSPILRSFTPGLKSTFVLARPHPHPPPTIIMKLPTRQLYLLICLGLVTAAKAGDSKDDDKPTASCSRRNMGIPLTKFFTIPLSRRYTIEAKNLKEDEDVEWVCDRLWKELKQFKPSCTVSKPKCEPNGPTQMIWAFNADLGCNKGMVHAAWWDSTKNKLGRIEC